MALPVATDKQDCILIVDDDSGIQNQLKWTFSDYRTLTAGNRQDAIDHLRASEPGAVLLDLGLPPDPGGTSEGMCALSEILNLIPLTKVIVVTGNDDRHEAIKAVAQGAYDYYQKPIDGNEIQHVVERALRMRSLELDNIRLQRQGESPIPGIIAKSPAMIEVCRMVEKIAPLNVSTLITGESGTGKELIAQAVHSGSDRLKQRLVTINCAAIPSELLESELFGHEKGAFTGATKQSIGKIESANGGTLFLDEVGDMPIELQGKMLRFLEERVIERVGGRKEIPVDIRVVSATHHNLQDSIASGSFREDLYYRISEVHLELPALRERDGDKIMLARLLLLRIAEEIGKPPRSYSPNAEAAIEKHTWPGNVREMRNRVKRAVIMADGSVITPQDLQLEEADEDNLAVNLREVRKEAERTAVVRVLKLTEYNISKAAKLLGITRPTLYDLMQKHDIQVSK